MRKVKEVVALEQPKEFTIYLTDGTTSPFILIRDEDEWVLQGDSEQRFCQSELSAILKEIEKLNPKDKK